MCSIECFSCLTLTVHNLLMSFSNFEHSIIPESKNWHWISKLLTWSVVKIEAFSELMSQSEGQHIFSWPSKTFINKYCYY